MRQNPRTDEQCNSLLHPGFRARGTSPRPSPSSPDSRTNERCLLSSRSIFLPLGLPRESKQTDRGASITNSMPVGEDWIRSSIRCLASPNRTHRGRSVPSNRPQLGFRLENPISRNIHLSSAHRMSDTQPAEIIQEALYGTSKSVLGTQCANLRPARVRLHGLPFTLRP